MYSSASIVSIQSPVAFELAKLRAAEKSSRHSKSYILSVYLAATSLVLSTEPVSTTTISSATVRDTLEAGKTSV